MGHRPARVPLRHTKRNRGQCYSNEELSRQRREACYLRQRLLQLAAGIAVLHHQDQGQEVGGVQRAGITAVEQENGSFLKI